METDHKIKEIAEKIHREGFEKASRDSERIIEEAKTSAKKIKEEARKEAEKIRDDAKRSAEELAERVKSEIRLSQQQALAHLKSDIAELIQTSVIKEPLNSSLEDQDFMSELLESMVKNWRNFHEDAVLQLLIPEEQLEHIEAHFQAKVKELMDQGLVVKAYPGIDKGFEIHPQEGNYKISMSDEAFEQFIKEHFKPKTIEFLFSDKNK